MESYTREVTKGLSKQVTMFNHRKLFLKGQRRVSPTKHSHNENAAVSLSYSWIMNGKLAVGPIPKNITHWSQLEDDGFRSRFSCCYPSEHIFPENPPHWLSAQVSLPDHREQEELSKEKLSYALQTCLNLFKATEGPLYLHCFAGQERSVLVAVGLVCILRDSDLFESLSYIKQCHNNAKPLYKHLEVLETMLSEMEFKLS